MAAAHDVPSLIAPDGRFWGWGYYRRPPPDWPQGSAPWATHAPSQREVETEFRAQVVHALRAGLKLAYLDCHLGLGCPEELLPITQRLAKEFCLAISSPEVLGAQRFVPDYPEAYDDSGVKSALLDALHDLQPGLHLHVGHPAVRSPELLAVDSDRGSSGIAAAGQSSRRGRIWRSSR